VLVPLTDHVAIVSLTRHIPMRELLRAAAAVQKQITRDLMPYWSVPATVDVFEDLQSMPSDYHPVVLFGDPDEIEGRLDFAVGAEYAAQLIDDFDRDRLAGLHLNTFTRQPFALVEASDTWSVTLSHEIIEMIVDPYGNRLVAAMHPLDPSQRVKFLLEICDPCQAVWYPVNGVPVSDFYTPKYLDPVSSNRIRYSFTGAVERPLQILDGGYVSWIDPRDSGLYQLDGGSHEPTLLANLSQLSRSTAPLRTVVDGDPRTPNVTSASLRPASTALSAPGAYYAALDASEGAALRTAEALVSLVSQTGRVDGRRVNVRAPRAGPD
jgi:hypothetical protein